MANKNRDLAAEGAEAVVVGHVYKEDKGDLEVIPFHVDLGTAQVRFAPVGRSSEDLMRTSDFLNRFTYFGPQSSLAEKQASKSTAEKK